MKPLSLISLSCGVLSLLGIANARELELRLLKTAGDAPTPEIMASLVNDPGAITAKAVTRIPDTGKVEIKQTTPYRYPSEYTPEGRPETFENRDLGLTGTATLSKVSDGMVNLTVDFTSTEAHPPRIYTVSNVQVMMPVFEKYSLQSETALKAGEWQFQSATPPGEKAVFWAFRVTGD